MKVFRSMDEVKRHYFPNLWREETQAKDKGTGFARQLRRIFAKNKPPKPDKQ